MVSWTILVACFFLTPAFAQSNGMVMSMDMPMNLAVGQSLPYIHFTPGDIVWFPGWVPSSTGSMIGTCIGLCLLAMLERWLLACLGLAERHWAERASMLALHKSDISSLPPPFASSSLPGTEKSKWLRIAPFVPEFDITRGVLFAAHASVRVLLMLVVMTFQLAFIASITVGSGVGETLFGRFSSTGDEH